MGKAKKISVTGNPATDASKAKDEKEEEKVRNYPPSTIETISDLKLGLRVETAILANATYLKTGGVQTELFNVFGRIFVHQLFLEIVVACSANATQVLFNCTFTTPVIAANPMCAKCAAITSLGQGGWIVWVGGAVATAAVITDSPGLSDVLPTSPQIVGGQDFVGTIGILSSDATQGSGSFKAVLHYTAGSDGAYAEAKL